MKVLFASISAIPNAGAHSISLDLLREFQRAGHNVYIICGIDKGTNADTHLSEEAGFHILRVKIGKNKKAGPIRKGLTTVMLPHLYIKALKKFIRMDD